MASPPPEKKTNPQLLDWLKKNSFGPGEVRGRKIAIFSNPGEGKTVLAARLGKRNLFITDEDGYTSLSNHPELNDKWRAVNFKSWRFTVEILRAVENGEFVFSDGEPFDHVILDTVTGMTSLELQKIVADGITPDKGRLSAETASQPDYLVSEKRFLPVATFIAQMRSCSVTMLFHLRSGTKDVPGASTRADVHGAVFKLANKYTSVMAHLFIQNGQRKLRVMPDGRISAKTRYHFPSEVVTDDDFVAHIEKWKGNN